MTTTTTAEVPWVIQGEPGPAILTKWGPDGSPYGLDQPIGYEPWCGTCGWHGDVQPFAEFGDAAWERTFPQAQAHLNETGHVAEDEEDA